MQKYTLKQIDDMSLAEALEATKPGTFEIVPSDVPGEDAAVMAKIDASIEGIRRMAAALESFDKQVSEL